MKVILLAFAAASLAPGAATQRQPAAGAAVNSPRPSPATPAADPLDVNGARLGMILQAWEALPYNSGPTSHVTTSCTAQSRPQPGFQRVRASDRPGALVCSYVARYGETVLQQAFPLTASFLAREPSYLFLDGRLSGIEFRTSVNAFNHLDALFTARFGPPIQTLRDMLTTGYGLSIPRVRREWRTARADIWIIDPSARLDQLIVRYSLADATPSIPNS